MNIHTMLPIFALSLVLAACSDSTEPPLPTPIDQGAAVDTTRDSGPPAPDSTVDTVPPGIPATVCAAIVEEGDVPRAGGNIQFCNVHVCLNGTFDEKGKVCVSVKDANGYLFHALFYDSGSKLYSDTFVPVEISQEDVTVGNTIDLGTLFAPQLAKTFALDADKGASIDFGNGSSLTVPANVAQLPIGVDTVEVGLVQVDKEMLHSRLLASYPGGADPLNCTTPSACANPVATFMIVPFDISFSSKVAYSLATDLPAATKLKMLWVNAETGILEEVGAVEVGSGGVISGDSAKGLSHLGMYLFVAE
jgi:hypothetical protein